MTDHSSPVSPIAAAVLAEAGPDPLGVLASCALVVNAARQVAIDLQAVTKVAAQLDRDHPDPPAWDEELHYRGTGPNAIEREIGWILALDALNFCFWGQEPDPAVRWRVRSGGATYDGYAALAIALRDAARAGTPVWDPHWQATVNERVLEQVLKPAPGSAAIPLMAARVGNLRELGAALLALHPGPEPATAFVRAANGSAPALARAATARFPSFNDVARWMPPDGGPPVTVAFHKRAQILASDLASAMGDRLPLAHRDQLTAFADYKVPQVLRGLGILRYADNLAGAIHRRERIPAGSAAEIEIRAATIWGCELLRQALDARGRRLTAADVDWLLWTLGQTLPATTEPYHRTVTIFY